MTESNFTTVISNFVADTEKKGLGIIKAATKNLIEDAQKPRGEGKGGKMPVDTGFLRSSGVASINQIPSGPRSGRRRKPGEVGPLPEYAAVDAKKEADVVLAKLKAGETFYFGWSARYAEYAEARSAFLASAVQKWQSFIDTAVGRLKK